MSRGYRFFLYLLSNGTAKGVPLLSLYVFSKYVDLADYGRILLVIAWAGILMPLLSGNAFMGLDRSIPSRGVKASAEEIGQIFWLVLVAHAILIVVLILADQFGLAIFSDVFSYAVVYSLFSSIVFLGLQVLKNIEKPFTYFFAANIASVGTFFGVLAAFLFGKYLPWGASAEFSYIVKIYILFQVISAAYTVSFLVGLGVSFKWPGGVWRRFFESRTYLLHSFSTSIINFSDRVALSFFFEPQVVGAYAAALLLGQSVSLIQDSYHKSYAPDVMRRYSSETDSDIKKYEIRSLKRIGGLLIIVGFLVSASLCLLSSYFLTQDYSPRVDLVLLIGFGYSINGIIKFFLPRLMLVGRFAKFATAMTEGALVKLALNFVLLPSLEGLGAAISTVLSFLYIAIRVYNYWNKNYDFK
ncbi:oligosaccharide flippase family protein [Zoogloea sp.]|uniref:lipopolysaccharide biosynthesis protein n=1 Tax=Zoogloea sp. TaxID=49181 RepID=UPI001AC1CF33|nr:oligosaccharide flippase family protein [Zoogloea sp.]MBN8282120.1 oligosaccharide flippase family protein [Zoogloea sp.]